MRLAQMLKYSVSLLVILVIAGFGAYFTRIKPEEHAIGYVFFILLGTYVMPRLFNFIWEKLCFLWQSKKIIKLLDRLSLEILASKRGMLFTTLVGLDESSIRYLISLKLIRSIVFPGSLDSTYYLTDLGRHLLEKELGFTLYYPDFCQMFLVLHWSAYKEFELEKNNFWKNYILSWQRCCDILTEQFRKTGIQLKQNIFETFMAYAANKDFNSIMEEIVIPWKQQVDKEKWYEIV